MSRAPHHAGRLLPSRSARRRARWALSALVALAAGCLVDVTYEDTRFTCSDGRCPEGFMCVAARCVPEETNDGGPVLDAAPADAALLTCDDQFGAVSGYVLCAEEAATCEFFVQVDVAIACTEVCAMAGASCVSAHDSDVGAECTRQTDEDCTLTHTSQLCVCTRGVESGSSGT